MRPERVLVAILLTVGLGGSLSAAPAARAQAQSIRPTMIVVEWPMTALPWNEVAYLTVHVSPAQPGRVVRLDMTGLGSPGYSELGRKRTGANGMVRLPLFTLCPDMPCTSMTQRYRVVVPATDHLGAARSRGTVRVVVPPGGY